MFSRVFEIDVTTCSHFLCCACACDVCFFILLFTFLFWFCGYPADITPDLDLHADLASHRKIYSTFKRGHLNEQNATTLVNILGM